MAIDLGSLEFFNGPPSAGGADDLLATLVAFIDDARDELDVAVQELEALEVVQALVAAEQRGVRVRLILERDYLGTDTAVGNPFAPSGENETNRELLLALLRSRVDIALDLNPAIFHQKFVVRDRKTVGRAAVLTGSTNFTPTGLGTVTPANRNHMVILRGKRITKLYAEEFDEMWNGTFGVRRERRDRKPSVRQVAGVPVKVLFAPDHAPEMEIMKQMLKATTRIDFAIFTFSQSSGIDDTMRCRAHGGIQVRGIIDRMVVNQTWAATHGLIGTPNISIFTQAPGSTIRKVHHKLMVLDGQVVIAGSHNFTEPATRLNDENIVIIGDLEADDPDQLGRQQQIGAEALAEIDDLIASGVAIEPPT